MSAPKPEVGNRKSSARFTKSATGFISRRKKFERPRIVRSWIAFVPYACSVNKHRMRRIRVRKPGATNPICNRSVLALNELVGRESFLELGLTWQL